MKQKLLHLFTLLAVLWYAGVSPAVAAEVTDEITATALSSLFSSTTASSGWYEFEYSGTSGAKYKIRTMKPTATTDALQWNANGYLYVTTSGGTLKSVIVNGSNGKKINVFGATKAYSAKATGNANYSLSLTGSDLTRTFGADTTYLAINGTQSSTTITSIKVVWETSGSSTPITVTLGDDNSTLTEATAGAGVTLPSRTATVGDYTFAGWSETNYGDTETTTKGDKDIIPAGSYKPEADVTLYPVYTRTEASDTPSETVAEVKISDYATANNWNNGTAYTSVTIDENVTASGDNTGNNSKYYNTGSTWRFYQTNSGKVTIATTAGTLKSVTFTFSVANTGTLNYNGSAITSETAVAVSGTNAEFTVGNSGTASNGNVQISKISVTYTSGTSSTTYYISTPVAAAVEKPVITVAETFIGSTTATITCATTGATIYYRYSESDEWTEYTGTLNITATTTITAKAVKGEDESAVVSKTTTKTLPTPTVAISGTDALTLDLAGETSVSAGTLTAAVTYDEAAVSGATVTWKSNNEAVATIDAATGAVTLLATGTVTFTATFAATAEYAEATATTAALTVINSKAPGTEGRPYTVAEARAAIDANSGLTDVYVTGIVSEIVTAYSSQYGNISYNISADGTTDADQLQSFRGKSYNGTNFSSADDIQVGDIVVLYGTLKKYNSTYELDADNQLVKLERKELLDNEITGVEESYKLNLADGEGELTFNATATHGTVQYEVISAGSLVEDDDYILDGNELTILSKGTVTIRAYVAADDEYKAAAKTITVTAIDPEKVTTAFSETETLAFGATLNVADYITTDGTVTVESQTEAVATAAGTTITTAAVGSTKITVSYTATDNYLAGETTFTLEVTAPEAKTTAPAGGEVLLFGETFGDNSDKARDWKDEYSDKNGVEAVYSGASYTVSNVKQGKNTTGSTKSGLNQSSQGTDASIIIGPLNVAGYSALTLNYQWKAGSIGAQYSTSASYATSAEGEYTALTATGTITGATTFVDCTYSLPEAAQVATLYIKVVWNTSNTQGIIDELKLNGTAATTLTATLNSSGLGTFASEYPLDFSDDTEVSAWQITDIKEDAGTVTLQFEQIEGTVKGGTGVLLKGEGDNAGKAATVTLTSADSSTKLDDNYLTGIYAPTYVESGKYYGLSADNFVKVNAGVVKAGKAVIDAEWIDGEEETPVKSFRLVFGDIATGLQTIQTLTPAEAAEVFDLSGRRLATMQRGVNIVNGRKVVVK